MQLKNAAHDTDRLSWFCPARIIVIVTSTFELFKSGVGPSSSHTMGPMTAGFRFVRSLVERGCLTNVERLSVTLFGSLALTGRGHATDWAVQLGLAGFSPETVNLDAAATVFQSIQKDRRIRLGGEHAIVFDAETDLIWGS